MLALRTTDDWTIPTVTVTLGGPSYTRPMGFTGSSAAEWADALVAGLTASTGAGWSWSWIRDTTGGAKLTLSHTTSFTLTCTPSSIVGFPASASGTTVTATAPAAGTWAPSQGKGKLSVALNYRNLSAKGDAGGSGACRPGVPGTAQKKPTIDALCTPTDAARLTSLLKTAGNPRTARLWQTHTASWLTIALGAIKAEPVGHTLYKVTIDGVSQ